MESDEEFFDAKEDIPEDPYFRKTMRERYYTVNNYAQEIKKEIDFSIISSVHKIELPITSSSWIIKFQPQGNHVAIAGSSNIILVYQIVKEQYLESPIYLNEHTYDITSLSWSKKSTLLSASIDHTIKEWAIRPSSIHTFTYHCRVISVSYLEQDDNYFVAAFEDFVIRLVNIPSKNIRHQVQLFESITFMAISNTGNTLAVGHNKGRVIAFSLRKSDYKLIDICLIKAKNRRGLKKSGKKVTGLFFLNDEEILVTTQDSNIRLFSLVDYQMKQKYKGAELCLKSYCAEITQDSQFVFCGGDIGKYYIWETICKGTKNRKFETVKVSKQKTPIYIFLAPEKTLDIFKQSQGKNEYFYAAFCIDTLNTLSIYLM